MAIETADRPFTPYDSEAEIMEIVEGFRSRTLPAPRWTHQAHLTVGLWHLLNRPSDVVLDEVRRGIIAYNTAVGTPNSDTRGYHETITAFYVWAIRKYLYGADTRRPLLDLMNGLLASPYATKSYPFEFYSRDRLLSVTARRTWLDPDLKPLD
ncbi:MAG TPA: hypothetical protein VLV76_10635 [Candidatus Acidoferrum sp.]|nr:hypothetical protein [Candidatus Acidoferrum sp.]